MQQLNNVPKFNTLPMTKNDVKVVLWDMDGTIMETEELHTLSTQSLLKEHHPDKAFSFKEIEEVCVGETDKTILDTFQKKDCLKHFSLQEFIDQKTKIIADELKTTTPEQIFKPEIRELMGDLQKNGIKQAVVTSSEKDITHVLLDFLGLKNFFTQIITREDTPENKPSPMPYLKAMELLKAKPDETLIFEDSQTGLTAAKKSNATFCQACWYSPSES